MFSFWQQIIAKHVWLKPLLEIVLLIFAAWLLGSLTRRWLRRWTERLDKTFRHSLIILLDRAITPVLVVAAIVVSLQLFPLPATAVKVINRIGYVGILAVLIYYASRAAHLFLERWLEGSPGRSSLREPLHFARNVAFAVFGTMIVLENLGVRLTAVWTTLGVGSVAVALALQDTLSNFFAGVYLHLDRPVRLDDYIKLESGEEGAVIRLGWRSTQLRTLQNNVVVVPNAKLAATALTNYSLPQPQMSLLIPVKVEYSCDPDRVEQILVEEAGKAARETPGLLADPTPFVRLIPGFGRFSLDFTLECYVQSFIDKDLVQDKLRKRILKRFRQEGIEVPFPQSDVRVHLSGTQGPELASFPQRG